MWPSGQKTLIHEKVRDCEIKTRLGFVYRRKAGLFCNFLQVRSLMVEYDDYLFTIYGVF